MLYRVSGLPADYLAVDALLVEDATGRAYLLEENATRLTPVEPAETTLLIGLYEPSIDATWRSEDDLVRTYGAFGHSNLVLSAQLDASTGTATH